MCCSVFLRAGLALIGTRPWWQVPLSKRLLPIRPSVRSSAKLGFQWEVFVSFCACALVRWGDGTAEQVGTTRPIAQTDLPIGSDRVELWFRLNLAMGGFCGDETGWSN